MFYSAYTTPIYSLKDNTSYFFIHFQLHLMLWNIHTTFTPNAITAVAILSLTWTKAEQKAEHSPLLDFPVVENVKDAILTLLQNADMVDFV